MKINTNPVRGTYDYSPKEMAIRESAREIILRTYKKHGFMQIKTPILESLNLLNSSDGGENLRLIFRTVKRGEKLDLTKPSLTLDDITEEGLRYDLTVPLARYYANNKENLPSPFKAIQIDDVFRAERPQRGRNRQFTQCDADILGDASINAEIEVLLTAIDAYSSLGFDKTEIRINSREILNQIILSCGFSEEDITFVCTSLDKLDKVGEEGVISELLEKGFNETLVKNFILAISKAKVEGISALSSLGVSDEVVNKISTIIREVSPFAKQNNSSLVFDVTIVRGQGYYTGTTFEVYADGFNGAIGGGGRYDNMIGKLIGTPVPAVGISIGFERVMLLQDKLATSEKTIAILFGNASFSDALKVKQELIKSNNASIYKKPKNLNNLLNKLKEVGFTHFIDIDREDATLCELK